MVIGSWFGSRLDAQEATAAAGTRLKSTVRSFKTIRLPPYIGSPRTDF